MVILEILSLQAYLAIGLISVIFAVYAICVSFINKEKLEFKNEQEALLKSTTEKISELTKKRLDMTGNNLETIDTELKLAKDERKKLENQINPLTAKGAVRNPVLSLFISLAVSIIEILIFEYVPIEQLILMSATSFFLISLSTLRLYQTILKIENAALRTEYSAGLTVVFPNNEKVVNLKAGKKKNLSICVESKVDVDNFEINAYIPKELNISAHSFDKYLSEFEDGIGFAEHGLCRTNKPTLIKKDGRAFTITVSPEKSGDYSIKIWITGKGIKAEFFELQINVKK